MCTPVMYTKTFRTSLRHRYTDKDGIYLSIFLSIFIYLFTRTPVMYAKGLRMSLVS